MGNMSRKLIKINHDFYKIRASPLTQQENWCELIKGVFSTRYFISIFRKTIVIYNFLRKGTLDRKLQ